MPKLIFKPQGQEPREWEFSFGKIMSPERLVIEKLCGGVTWNDVQRGFWSNSTPAVHALLYVMLKRDGLVRRPEDVAFCDDDYDLDLTDEEKVDYVARADEHADELDDDERAKIEELRKTLPVEPEPVEDAEATDPKADEPTSSSETTT